MTTSTSYQQQTRSTNPKSGFDLSNFLDSVISRLGVEAIYSHPSHQFKASGDRYRGGCPFHESKSGSSFVVSRDSLLFWCEGCRHGGDTLDYLFSLQVGWWDRPRGQDFIETVKQLAELAGTSLPEFERSPEAIEKSRQWESRRVILQAVMEYSQQVLWSSRGDDARKYLIEERGLTEAQIRDLGLGLYSSREDVERFLRKNDYSQQDAQNTGVVWSKLEGYILFPWLDSRGRPLTLYGRYQVKTAPEGKPKTIALKGEGTKQSPLYLDRALKAGHKDIILVEGVIDAALLQAQGDTRVCAYVAASCSGQQIETLKRHQIESVTLCGDPDDGGENGTLSNVERIGKAGIKVYVAPKLPDGLDPDEFLLREGLEGWNRHIASSIHGFSYKAQRILAKFDISTDFGKTAVIEEAIAFARTVTDVESKLSLETFFWPTICEALGMSLEKLRKQLEDIYYKSNTGESQAKKQTGDFKPSDIPKGFDPAKEFTQQIRRDLYSDKPWICINNTLHYWTGNHYEPSLDVVEIQRLWHYCNGYAVADGEGNVRYPYASPSAVKKALEWVKMAYGVNPALIDPPGLNCTNGVLQLSWDGSSPKWQLVDHDPALFYTYEPVVTYNPDADPTNCDRLLAVLDAPHQDIFLKTVAASLDLTTVRQHKGRLVRCLLLKGYGSNGKDTLRECVAAMYGYRGMTSATLTDFAAYDQGRKFPLARLSNSRVNWASENANTTKLDKIQSLKAFVTGDPISIEGKGRDEYDFDPVGVALFNVNDTPRLEAAMDAIKTRYGILTFSKTFKIGADLGKGELEADPRFKYDPDFLRNDVLPAFLNRVLDALTRLMADGIDYNCTQQALEAIQAENSHLFQFCQDVGLGYDSNGTVTAGEIWDRLEEWYLDNGTLTYEESSNGKLKSLWVDQARRDDANVKGANQVIGRFQHLFPKAKRVTVGKGKMALQGISFTLITLVGEPVEPVGEPVEPVGESVVSQLVSQKPLPDKDGEPVTPVFLRDEKNEIELDVLVHPQTGDTQKEVRGEELTRLAHHPVTASNLASPIALPTASLLPHRMEAAAQTPDQPQQLAFAITPQSAPKQQQQTLAEAPAEVVAQAELNLNGVIQVPLGSATPAANSERMPTVNEQVELLHFGTWQIGTVVQSPNHHPDPQQRISGWKVRVESGHELFVWQAEQMRRLE